MMATASVTQGQRLHHRTPSSPWIFSTRRRAWSFRATTDEDSKSRRARFGPRILGSGSIVAACLFAGSSIISACASSGARSPEELRRRYAQALQRDDPDAAYALMSPEIQAQTGPKQFAERWRSLKKERETSREAINTLDAAHQKAIRGGVTIHMERILLTWVDVGGTLMIASGLPSIPATETPKQAIRALIAALRTSNLRGLSFLLTDETNEAMTESWKSRIELIEDQLDDPNAIEFSPDKRRASLRYEPGSALTLEQTQAGWRFTGLQ